MDLHRTTKKPEWEKTKPARYSSFQKVAANTNGIITPANVITLIGFAVVIYGLVVLLQHHYWLGLVLLGLGRLCDIADGFVAEVTHTKSPVGEILDAVVDKLETLCTILVLVVSGITNWWVIAAFVVPQAIISGIIFYKRRRGIRLHPSRSGKLSMAAIWASVVGLIALKALDSPVVLATAVYAMIAASVGLGLYAAWQYLAGRD
jgi:cardiolipin synthase